MGLWSDSDRLTRGRSSPNDGGQSKGTAVLQLLTDLLTSGVAELIIDIFSWED